MDVVGSAVGPLRAPQKFQVNAGTRLNAECWAICANRYLKFSICASAIRSSPPNGRISQTMPATSPTTKTRSLRATSITAVAVGAIMAAFWMSSAALAQL